MDPATGGRKRLDSDRGGDAPAPPWLDPPRTPSGGPTPVPMGENLIGSAGLKTYTENRVGQDLNHWRRRKVVLAFAGVLDRDKPAVSPIDSVSPVTSADLALDMVGRAYLALALLYETAHPGEFQDVQRKVRAFVEDNFRIIQETSRSGTLADETVDGATHLVNSVLEEAENKIATMIRPSRHPRGQLITEARPLKSASVAVEP